MVDNFEVTWLFIYGLRRLRTFKKHAQNGDRHGGSVRMREQLWRDMAGFKFKCFSRSADIWMGVLVSCAYMFDTLSPLILYLWLM